MATQPDFRARFSRRRSCPTIRKRATSCRQWLRTFSLWCRHGFADKLSQTTAAPGLLLQATDDPTKIFMVQVNAAGAITRRRFRSAEASHECAPYHAKLKRLLDRMGGLYTLHDILSARRKRDADLVEGDSWALTQIAIFPRARWSRLSPLSAT